MLFFITFCNFLKQKIKRHLTLSEFMEFYLPCYTSYIVEKLSVLLPVKLYIRVCGRQDFTTMLNKMATLSFATVLNKRVTNHLKAKKAVTEFCYRAKQKGNKSGLLSHKVNDLFCYRTKRKGNKPSYSVFNMESCPCFLTVISS